MMKHVRVNKAHDNKPSAAWRPIAFMPCRRGPVYVCCNPSSIILGLLFDPVSATELALQQVLELTVDELSAEGRNAVDEEFGVKMVKLVLHDA